MDCVTFISAIELFFTTFASTSSDTGTPMKAAIARQLPSGSSHMSASVISVNNQRAGVINDHEGMMMIMMMMIMMMMMMMIMMMIMMMNIHSFTAAKSVLLTYPHTSGKGAWPDWPRTPGTSQ